MVFLDLLVLLYLSSSFIFLGTQRTLLEQMFNNFNVITELLSFTFDQHQ